MPALLRPLFADLRRLRRDRSGLAMIEFAFTLPILVMMSLGGAELTNYISVRMRISQIALQLADNAARMGSGSQLAAKSVDETDINDILTGAQIASGGLDLKTNGRVILSDLEPTAAGSTKYTIKWQRCFGNKVHASTYGNAGDTNLNGIGPAGRQVTAEDGYATMFVEVNFTYKPIFQTKWAPSTEITEIASMAIRDRRDLTAIYNKTNLTPATC